MYNECTIFVQRIDGIAMESPLGPLLADIFMAKLERSTLSDIINSVQFYRRYIDDIFIVHRSDLSELTSAFNAAHPSISFTFEAEKGGLLPFMDVLLERTEHGTVRRSVYHKPTWTGQYLNFFSSVPMQRKRNLVKTLASRVYRISSDECLDNDISKLKDVLRKNGYPDRFIEKNTRPSSQKAPNFNVPKKDVYINVPYINDSSSEILERKLNAATRRTYYSANLKVFFRSKPVVIPKLKDKLPEIMNLSAVVQLLT